MRPQIHQIGQMLIDEKVVHCTFSLINGFHAKME